MQLKGAKGQTNSRCIKHSPSIRCTNEIDLPMTSSTILVVVIDPQLRRVIPNALIAEGHCVVETANSSRQSGDHTAAVNPTFFESLSLSFERRLNLTLDIPSSFALTRGSAPVSNLHRPSYLLRLLKIVGKGMSSDLTNRCKYPGATKLRMFIIPTPLWLPLMMSLIV